MREVVGRSRASVCGSLAFVAAVNDRRRPILVVVAVAIGLFGVAFASLVFVIVWKMVTVTDPFVVEPISVSPAPKGTRVGYVVDAGTRTLSIVSGSRVIVVADPGASFQYVDLWLVEKPRRDGSRNLLEFNYQLPAYSVGEHIHPVGSPIPSKIQRAADAAPRKPPQLSP